ncbi:MAG TPA: hypothetical protein VI306_21830 [Pyrinomonadaceae bacterium]
MSVGNLGETSEVKIQTPKEFRPVDELTITAMEDYLVVAAFKPKVKSEI